MIIKKAVNVMYNYLTSADQRFIINAKLGLYNRMDDEQYICRLYRALVGKELNLRNPQTFNEKQQWLKLYDRKPVYFNMVDKIEAKKYVAERIGSEVIIPTLHVWNSVEAINFEVLPDRFVLKCNHNSGTGMIICKNKRELRVKNVKRELAKGLKQNYYLTGREWPYSGVIPRIMCEAYIENKDGSPLMEYKFQCANGKVIAIFVCVERFSATGVKFYYFDTDWNYLAYMRNQKVDPKVLEKYKPVNLKKMVRIAEELSAGLPQLRVDLYEVDEKVYFGEMTFFTQSGFDMDITEEADLIMGRKIQLPLETWSGTNE